MSAKLLVDEENQLNETRWPLPGDRALLEGDWELNACMPSQYTWASSRWHGYIEGYRRSAEVLFQQVQEHRADLDVLVYPFVFLWRQHIELLLKRLISYAQALSTDDEDDGYPMHHTIKKLWEKCRDDIVKYEPKLARHCDGCDGIIEDLSRVDPESFEFRYPEDRKRNHTLAKIEQHLNFGTFHENLCRLSNFLGDVISEVSSRLENIREYRREMRAYYGE